MDNPDLEALFQGRRLERGIPGYTPRPLQIKFARAVEAAMETGGLHLFEAGTGIGKSIAYVIPAILSGRKIFISTATITLQDQLAEKDVPGVLKALESEARVTVLKGRRNYLCARKFQSALSSAGPELTQWAETTGDGDITSFPEKIPSSLWRHFRSDHLDCLGTSCGFRGKCFFLKARNLAKQADILILNHHLLISGLLAEEVLPEADVLVIDEGHRLEDAASECLGLVLGEGMLLPLYDGIAFSTLETDAKAALLESTRRLSASIADLTEGIRETSLWDPVDNTEGLKEVARMGKQLAKDVEGCEEMQPVAQAAGSVAETARAFLGVSTEEYCCFAEKEAAHAVLKAVPLDIGPDLGQYVYSRFDTTVITSATLTVASEFDFFQGRLGAWEARTKRFGSPFDYGSQAVLSIPDDLPSHDSHARLAAMAWEWGRKLASALDGRTLMLFTSYRNLKMAAALARDGMPEGQRLFVQGEMSRSRILDEFRKCSRGVIMGTSSFWEGVDLPGRLLQAVVIDRLPFASPGHPLIRARMDYIEKHGGSSFAHYSLPLAAVRLRQGVGRLIRSLDDIGAVMIMDRRLVTKGYGRVFLSSIPPFRIVSRDDLLKFVMEHCGDSGVSQEKDHREVKYGNEGSETPMGTGGTS